MSVDALTVDKRSQVRLKSVALPVEHGSWGFLLEPLVAGLAIAFSLGGMWIALMTIGAFLVRQPLKVLIIDRLGMKVRERAEAALAFLAIYGAVFTAGLIGTIASVGWWPLLPFAIVLPFAAYQIYCDFSGYSDIAIGSARVLGFKLMENFDAPYYSRSIAEFWRRWHISLSTWFRDYVYFPLGGSRVSPLLRARNILVTFAISGLWHGAAWTYVVWGVVNGLYLVVGSITQPIRARIYGWTGLNPDGLIRQAWLVFGTFFLTCVAWVIFRARNLDDAWYILTHAATNWDFRRISTEQFLLRQMPAAMAGIAVLEIGQLLQRRVSIPELLRTFPTFPRWSLYAGFVLSVLMFGIYREAQFIYFQF